MFEMCAHFVSILSTLLLFDTYLSTVSGVGFVLLSVRLLLRCPDRALLWASPFLGLLSVLSSKGSPEQRFYGLPSSLGGTWSTLNGSETRELMLAE